MREQYDFEQFGTMDYLLSNETFLLTYILCVTLNTPRQAFFLRRKPYKWYKCESLNTNVNPIKLNPIAILSQ